ncbi:MAG: hypothetical protein CMJ19_10540 [Phycisphaeraceae bacterium]|nr:hypothetical protein [Phycisphaeraceae bacterium]
MTEKRNIRHNPLLAVMAIAMMLLIIVFGVTFIREIEQPKDQTSPAPQSAPLTDQTLTNSLGMTLIRLEPGRFMMGSGLSTEQLLTKFGRTTSGYKDEFPQHEVHLTQPFYLAATHVTRKQFAQFINATQYQTTAQQIGWVTGMTQTKLFGKHDGLTWDHPGFEQADDHPVVCVSYDDAVAFCQWLSNKENLTYRLPTEAQWEYACRAGTDTLFWWGNELQEAQGKENLHDASYDNWYATLIHSKGFMRWLSWDDGYAQTSPVGKYQANPWGLYDMLGNATQWVRDGYAPYASEKRIDPIGPNQAKRRITRGGNWYVIPHYARSSRRSIVPAPFVSNTLGFRVMLEVK